MLSAVLLCLQAWVYEARSPLSQGRVIIPFQMRKQAWGGRGPSAGEAAGEEEGMPSLNSAPLAVWSWARYSPSRCLSLLFLQVG